MFDFFRKHTWLLQIVLALVVLGFVGTGVYQGYGSFMNDQITTVAKVNGHKISRAEWEAAQQQQIEQARQRAPNIDPKVFDTPEMRAQSLDAVVRDRVMLAAADQEHLMLSNERLQRLFATDPQFASIRNADGSVNRDALAAQGLSSEMFAQRLREDLSVRQVLQGIAGSTFGPVAVTTVALNAMFQQREMQLERFDAKDYLSKVAPTDADIQAYYKDPANAKSFFASESESIQYVVLDLGNLKKDVTVSDKDLHDYYTANEVRYTVPEERRASHILVKVQPGASAADKAKAKTKAEMLLAEIQKNPASFADVARKNSDDSGSAANGGDLDFFTRGGLAAKAVEEAAFKMKPNDIAGPIESEFGYHIVKLTGIRGGEKKSFDAVRPEMEAELKNQLAQKRFNEMATEFSDMVSDQPDSLKPIADKFKLELKTADHVLRKPAQGSTGPLYNPKFLDALFSTDAIANKRNTDAIETAPNTLVSGHVISHEPAHLLPFDQVRTQVRERVVQAQALALTRKLGEARLASVKAALDKPMAGPAVTLSRSQPHDLPPSVVDALLRTPIIKLPKALGLDIGNSGYVVARITKVLDRDPVTADITRGQSQYAQIWADAESQAYYNALKKRLKVEIKPEAVQQSNDSAAGSLNTLDTTSN